MCQHILRLILVNCNLLWGKKVIMCRITVYTYRNTFSSKYRYIFNTKSQYLIRPYKCLVILTFQNSIIYKKLSKEIHYMLLTTYTSRHVALAIQSGYLWLAIVSVVITQIGHPYVHFTNYACLLYWKLI